VAGIEHIDHTTRISHQAQQSTPARKLSRIEMLIYAPMMRRSFVKRPRIPHLYASPVSTWIGSSGVTYRENSSRSYTMPFIDMLAVNLQIAIPALTVGGPNWGCCKMESNNSFSVCFHSSAVSYPFGLLCRWL